MTKSSDTGHGFQNAVHEDARPTMYGYRLNDIILNECFKMFVHLENVAKENIVYINVLNHYLWQL